MSAAMNSYAPEFAGQPDLRELQIAIYGSCADIHRFGNFLYRHPGKKPELNHLGLSGIDVAHARQRLVQGNDIRSSRQVGWRRGYFLDRNMLSVPSSLNRAFFSGVIHQHSSHNLRDNNKELFSALPIHPLDIEQLQESLINERRG